MLKEIYKLGELTIQSNIRNTERVTHPLRDLHYHAMQSANTVEVVQKKENMRES